MNLLATVLRIAQADACEEFVEPKRNFLRFNRVSYFRDNSCPTSLARRKSAFGGAFLLPKNTRCGMEQSGSSSGSYPGGRRFKSGSRFQF